MGKSRQSVAAVTLAALMLASCGGGGGSDGSLGSGGTVTVPPTPTPTPTPTANCGLAARQSFAKAVIDEWYLFPNDVANGVSPSSYSSVQSYIDALVAPARALNKDRFFTYITSIAEENAFYASGSSAGFGVRLAYDAANQQIVIAEAYEGAPAFAAGIDRGTAIVGIGTTSGNIRSVSSIVAAEGTAGLTSALGPNDPGVSRVLRISDAAGTRDVTVAKTDYALDPVSDRYGAKVISEGGRNYGYINLRTFISSADQQLRTAFLNFRNQGVTDIIIDFRYNGGGLVSTAELMGDLLGRNRTSSEIFSQLNFRPSKASNNETRYFAAQPESIAPTRIAFIGTGSTASASELVINSMLPYLGTSMTLVGANTYGKPVGQIALDRAECDDRMRVVAFATANSAGASDYYDGLAPKIANSCAANDDLSLPLGDPREASVRAAIGFLSGTACTTRIADASAGAAARSSRSPAMARPEMLMADRPSAAQRDLPGLF
ncbi:S41 family peptidase [Sphingopyxis sp. RIFCSPHIGHO2_12_FULL_65_19]|uniref:S41 family peptidase n=1 Tax=Sphingopyxis sp. RIFCSPHIGHO2_12_FULL_65_19 TaxID=1802172 RepID=UPI0008CC3A3A|nr:S41 family peptidase [Sphingopyxis sp. RIFCSPHIGHO2_12_FULL_65_19]OHD08053.1 MAG: peptidase S41 [Sphingopyxis sp. RIFCSPHIGHO2_12_FULL_65_19]